MNKTVRIFSNDSRFLRMLELELNSLGIDVVNNELFTDNIERGWFSVVDLDTDEVPKLEHIENSEKVIYFSKKEEYNFKDKMISNSVFFKRPFSMSDFLDVFKIIKTDNDTKSRSSHSLSSKQTILIINDADKTAIWGDVKISLSENEYRVLSYLYENRNSIIDRKTLNSLFDAKDGNIGDVYICHLRKKIDHRLGIKIIYTIHGKGYMLKN